MLRRALPLLAAVLLLAGIAVWVRDVRAAYLAVIVLVVLALVALRRPREPGEVPYRRPATDAVTTSDEVVNRLTGAFLVVAALAGAALSWSTTKNPVAVVGGALLAAVGALVVAGLAAALVSLAAVLVRRVRAAGPRG